MDSDGRVGRSIQRWSDSDFTERADTLAREEPLEIQINGVSAAVLMRTPGHDEELGLGFLYSEGIITEARDVLSIRHCTVAPHPEAEDNVLQIQLEGDVQRALDRLRRNVFPNSSCGVCGEATIDDLRQRIRSIDDGPVVDCRTLYPLSRRLREAQELFDGTGGVHAAGLFDARGTLLKASEDVGRHNAVDKLIGWTLCQGLLPLNSHIILVSGRVAFEIVQKAAMARAF